MAIVRRLTQLKLERETSHSEVKDCTYSVITGGDGRRSLQIDTYGSAQRKMQDKKSQSIRFSPEAIDQLRRILAEEL
jgi:hypothetical protein